MEAEHKILPLQLYSENVFNTVPVLSLFIWRIKDSIAVNLETINVVCIAFGGLDIETSHKETVIFDPFPIYCMCDSSSSPLKF